MKILLTLLMAVILSVAACSRSASDFDDRVTKAEAEIALGNYFAAVTEYASIVDDYSSDPRRAGVLLRIADLNATTLGNPEEAFSTYGRVIAEEPLTEAARLARERRAAMSERLGDNERAVEDYSALLKHFSEKPEGKLYRVKVAGVYLSMRDFRQARIEIKPLFKDKEVSKDILEKAIFIAAESYFLEGRSKKASGYYRWLLEEFPDSELAPEAKLHMATCYEEMGFLGVAGSITRSARKDYPNERVIDARLTSLKVRGTNPESSIPGAPEQISKAPAAKRAENVGSTGKEGENPTKKSLQSPAAPLASPRFQQNETKGERHGG